MIANNIITPSQGLSPPVRRAFLFNIFILKCNNMKKVAILYGGPSSEHNVSVNSAKNILRNIDRKKYTILEVYINKQSIFCLKKGERIIKKFDEKDFIKFLKKENVYKVFPVLHGKYGEDGKLQKVFEKNKINFVGSGSKSSANAIDKNKSNKIYFENNILIPKSKIITEKNPKHNLNYPIIIKPVDEGSSFGLFKFENEKDFLKNISKIFKNYKNMLAQECVSGREFTCGVLEIKNKIKPLSVSEVVLTKTKTFDYKAKYTKGAVKEITPARIDKKLTKQIQNIAKKCHEILNCKDISRTDIILNKNDNKLYILETNTLPGMTETSFIPEQAKSSGITISHLIDILIS